VYEYTDRKNRTLAERIDDAAERRPARARSEQDKATATALLADMLQAAAKHGIDLDALDLVTDLPGSCYRAVSRNGDLAGRINTAAARRPAEARTEQDKATATALLADMLRAAARHGLTLDTFDWVTDLPGACYRAVARHRELAERINDVSERRSTPGTEEEKAAATALLADMLEAAAKHGIVLDAFDWVTDLPGGCFAAVVSKLRTRAVQWATAS
jgi:sugar phosphate isomerase/epimerase